MDQRPVKVNVYDITQGGGNWLRFVGRLGLGVHHSGVVIGNAEYTYGTAGIVRHEPRQAKSVDPSNPRGGEESNAFQWKCELDAGIFRGSHNEVTAIIKSLRESSRFGPSSYDPINNNCNHFSAELALELTGYEVPAWVNRPARFGERTKGAFSSMGSLFRRKPPAEADSIPPAPSSNPPSTQKRTLTDKQLSLLANLKEKK